MAKKRVRALVLAIATLLCCLVLITGATYALFAKDVTLPSHLHAGQLDVELVRESYVWKHIDENGFVSTKKSPAGAERDFSDTTTDEDNIFGLTENDLTAPGCTYTANLRLTNTGDVAFKYWVVVELDGAVNELAGQLQISIAVEGVSVMTEDVFLADAVDGLSFGEEKGLAVVGIKAPHNVSHFSVSVTFVNVEENNAARNQEVTFDLTVYAEQVTDMPEGWGA